MPFNPGEVWKTIEEPTVAALAREVEEALELPLGEPAGDGATNTAFLRRTLRILSSTLDAPFGGISGLSMLLCIRRRWLVAGSLPELCIFRTSLLIFSTTYTTCEHRVGEGIDGQ